MNFDATAIIHASIISTCKYRKKEDTYINSLRISNFPNCLEATIYACAMIVSAKLKIEKENCIEERDETRVELLDTSLIDLYFH